MLALKPYWGKPAVRNFRGGDGNVGIIRSPVRAIALLDHTEAIITNGQPFRVDGNGPCPRYAKNVKSQISDFKFAI